LRSNILRCCSSRFVNVNMSDWDFPISSIRYRRKLVWGSRIFHKSRSQLHILVATSVT
jgi:hypothetical protein